MTGRFLDVWAYVWPEIWLALEQADIWIQLAEDSGYSADDLYMDVYVEFAKALKKAPQPEIYDATANNPVLARKVLETTSVEALRGETATVRFFEDAFETISAGGSSELQNEYRDLVQRFLSSRNLRYTLVEPFKLLAHLPGVFAALFSDIQVQADRSDQLRQALADFQHAFHTLEKSHSEADMKTSILKATMLTEALASAVPGARGKTLAELCNTVQCWPHSAIKEAVKRIYGFCSDYPGIRHNISSNGLIRSLEVRDSVIVPLLLLTTAGYFGENGNLLDALRSQAAEPRQEPPDPPAISEAAANTALP